MLQKSLFGDMRLARRFDRTRKQFRTAHNSVISYSFNGHSEQAASYRFFSNPKVTVSEIQKCNSNELTERLNNIDGPILMIQDSTTFNYSTHPCTKNLGRINTKSKPGYGLIVHNPCVLIPKTMFC